MNWSSKGLQGLKNCWLMVATLVLLGGSAFAVGTSCDTLTTTPTVTNAITCMIDTVAPYTILVAVLVAFMPVILVIWGFRGTFSLMARVVSSMFSFLIRRG